MFKRFRRPQVTSKRYNFYVWENGSYTSVNGKLFPTDEAAARQALRQVDDGPIPRPASLDAPHLHVVREDGIHIITVELTKPSLGCAAEQAA
jgi:hypothetical protein